MKEPVMSERSDRDGRSGLISRRTLLQWSGITAGGALVGLASARAAAQTPGAPVLLEEITVAQLQAAMESGRVTSERLVQMYIERINALDRHGPTLRAVQELNPDAVDIARSLDAERKARGPRGPLHGIPVLLKDNIDTADKLMTTAGSLALVGAKPVQDATIARKLRDAGLIILGKATMSEWAYFKGSPNGSGWSARGGQCRNPYALDRTPCGSSAGSAVAVAANLVTVAIGTETDGSIVCPSGTNAVVGIKPTVGLTSRAGVIPIAHSQDTVGPFGRTVADAATVLGALTGVDPRDTATQASAGKSHTDYTRFLDRNGLRGARIGVPREGYWGYSAKADRVAEEALKVMKSLGAEIIDPADIPTAKKGFLGTNELTVLLYEFKADLNAYLASLGPGAPVRTLADIIEFNKRNAAQELPFYGQELMIQAEAKGSLTEAEYLKALEENHRLSRQEGIDAVMDQHKLDALVAPTGAPPWKIDPVNGDHIIGLSSQTAALAGYPLISVPAGWVQGLPVGITFMGRAWSEPTLIKLAYAYEQASLARRAPQFLATVG
jgi:amidase